MRPAEVRGLWLMLACLVGIGLAAAPGAAFVASRPYQPLPLADMALLAPLGIAGSLLVYAPGLLWALVLAGPRDGLGGVLFKAAALTFLVLAPLTAVLGLVVPLQGAGFALFLGIAAATGVLALRHRGLPSGLVEGRGADIAAMVLVPLAFLWLLFPKMAWDSFNGDGAHVFLSMRQFIATGLPFWPEGAGPAASYPSVSTLIEVIGGAFYVRLFGELELAARLPVLAGLAILTGIGLDLIRRDRPEALQGIAVAAFGAAIVLYAAALGWQASYNPYFADIALPLAREPLVMVSFLGYLRFVLDRAWIWAFVFALLTVCAIPSAPVLIALLLGAVVLVFRPVPWRQVLAAAGVSLLAFALAMAVPRGLAAAGIIAAADEFGADNLLARLRYVTPFEIERLIYIAVPVGLLPVLGLAGPSWGDRLGRVLALVAIGYGAFFYLQAYRVLPHHFAPVPILALIAFWRAPVVLRAPRLAVTLAAAGIAIGFWLERPADWRPHEAERDLGERIAIVPLAEDGVDVAAMAAAQELLRQAFPMDYSETATSVHYVGSPLAWFAHAEAARTPEAQADYVLRQGSAMAGEVTIGTSGDWTMVTRDAAIWLADRDRTGVARSINTVFYVPRGVIFGRGARSGPRPVFDLARITGLR